MTGEFGEWSDVERIGKGAVFRFCPDCGTTIGYVIEAMPGLTAIPVGTFADPSFLLPWISVYERRRHPWVVIEGDEVEHFD
jgi:hypothetical protein